MEKKSFNWLLFQFAQRQISLNMLEVGFCRRERLLDWYCLNSNGQVHRNLVSSPSNQVKYLMSHFLSKRSPVLDEYKPDKFICYLYHKNGRKIISAKEAAELVNNQMHGLEITSMHLALPGIEDPSIFRVSCNNSKNELHLEIETRRFDKEKGSQLKDQNISDKIVNFVVGLCEMMGRFSKTLLSMNLDLLMTGTHHIFLVKIDELIFQNETFDGSKDFQRVSSFKPSEGTSEEISDDEIQHNLMIPEKEIRKREMNRIRVPLNKPIINNSPVFLEMIAKTIHKNRKKQFFHEYFQRKKFSTDDKHDLKKASFHFNSRDTFKEMNLENRLDSLSDLLSFLEKTRPKNWVRDLNVQKISTIKQTGSRKLSADLTQPDNEKQQNQGLLDPRPRNSHKTFKDMPRKFLHTRSASDSKLPSLEAKYFKII
jgi:hypothetical protein